MTLDLTPLRAWIGRQESAGDTLTPFPAAALAATLDRDDAPASGEPLPLLWHWVYFNELHRTAELADNGHARLGDFMPPVPLPRRMYAGGRIALRQPLRIGEAAQRVSTVADLSAKQGGSGELAFLKLRHEYAGPAGLAIVEEQDIVYREAARYQAAPDTKRAPGNAPWRRAVELSEALLFRYSALTFNAYRIHYDRAYCEREGYPGLIVHGPLIATLLADLVRRHTDARVTAFSFRAVRPLFLPSPCVVCGVPGGDSVALWAEDGEGGLVMEAQAELSAAP